MSISVWCLLASLLVASVAGQLYDVDPQSFYENLESASPAPESALLENQAEAREVILYLTSEQAEALKSAGADVQPLPELSQEQNNPEQTETQTQPASEENSNDEREQEDYFKALNVEQQERESEEDSSSENQSAEEATEKSPQNYKYASKTRQRLSSQTATKKFNKGKSGYARYLPNQDLRKLKPQRNRAHSRPNYVFKNINLNIEPEVSSQAEAVESQKTKEIKNVDELRQVVKGLTRFLSKNSEQSEEARDESAEVRDQSVDVRDQSEEVRDESAEVSDESAEDESSIHDKGPVTFQGKYQDPAPVRESLKSRLNIDAENKPRTIQRQYSSLLAPLVQHEKIMQSINEQKEELLKNERQIKNKLQQIKESATHDQEVYAAEIEKLNKNLLKQNELAEKLALESAAKQSRTQLTKGPEVSINGRRPVESEKEDAPKPIPVLVQIPKPSEWSWPESTGDFRPISVPVLQNLKPKKLSVKILNPVPIPRTRQYYINSDKPEYKPEIPSSLALIRHIWDN